MVCSMCLLPKEVREEVETGYTREVKPISAPVIARYLKTSYPDHVKRWNGSNHASAEAVRRHFRDEHHLRRSD